MQKTVREAKQEKVSVPYREEAFPPVNESLLCIAKILSLWLLISTFTNAENYSPEGMYSLERLDLPNGFTILTKQRQHASNISIRLAVGVGFDDYSCVDEELPHLIEHLMFAGTSNYSESDIEQYLDSWGGFSNASTTRTQTVYEFDVHSLFQIDAINLLHEMLSDSVISEDRITNSIDIVHQESGNTRSDLDNWIRNSGIFDTVSHRVLVEAGYRCSSPPIADHFIRQQILDAYKTYYTPSNMTLIVVGDINPEFIDAVTRSFGEMENTVAAPRTTHTVKPLSKKYYENGIWPLVGNQAEVGFIYEIPGYRSEDRYKLDLLSDIFNARIYEVLRINKGVSYNPVAAINMTSNGGFFEISTDVSREKIDLAVNQLHGFINDVISSGLDLERIKRTKQGKLVANSILYETNSDLAEFYVSSLEDLDGRHFYNMETDYLNIGKEELEATVQKYLASEPVVLVTKPFISYKGFLFLSGVLSIFILLAILTVIKRIYQHKN